MDDLVLPVPALAFAALALAIVPREEAELVRTFGDAYRAYQERTGRLFPRGC